MNSCYNTVSNTENRTDSPNEGLCWYVDDNLSRHRDLYYKNLIYIDHTYFSSRPPSLEIQQNGTCGSYTQSRDSRFSFVLPASVLLPKSAFMHPDPQHLKQEHCKVHETGVLL